MVIEIMVKCPDLDMQLEKEIDGLPEEVQEKFREQFHKFVKWNEIVRLELPEDGIPIVKMAS